MNPFEYELDEEQGFFHRNRGAIVTGALIVLSAGVFLGARALTRMNQKPIRHEEMIMAVITTPPPPKPTPTPESTPPPIQKTDMVIQNPIQSAPKPPTPKVNVLAPPGPIGTSIVGAGGPDAFGLGKGLGEGGGYGNGAGGGGKYDWYASEIQQRIADAVRNDTRARGVNLSVVARIWPDSTGRIARAKVSGGGNSPVEATTLDNILTGIQLPDPPPSDMPLPIIMRLSVAQSH